MPLGHLPSHGLTFISAPSTDPSVVVLSRIAVIGISVPPGVVSGGTGISTGVDFIVFQKKSNNTTPTLACVTAASNGRESFIPCIRKVKFL